MYKKLSKEEIKKKIEHQREKQKEYAERQKEKQRKKWEDIKKNPEKYYKKKKELTEEEKAKKIEKAKETQRRMIERAKEKAKEKPKEYKKPIKKKARKKYKGIDVRSDFCIMPEDERWSIKREEGLERHEVFGGAANRPKSISDGLVIFLTPYQHRIGIDAIHNNSEFRSYAKNKAMKAWMQYYNKTKEEFFARYGEYA